MGDPDGNFMVALMYSNGLGVKADQSLVIFFFNLYVNEKKINK